MKGASEREQTSAKQRMRQQKTTTTLESLRVPLLVTALSNHRRQLKAIKSHFLIVARRNKRRFWWRFT
jgi:hypothetical protein